MKKSIPELVKLLNYYTEKYESGHPEISDEEWDELYFELVQDEKESGYTLPDSPTHRITNPIVSSLEKVEHNHKMLSLDKTKDLNEIKNFISVKDKNVLAMCKMDGLTCSLTYRGGRLVAAETRGNGLVGENILHNIQFLPSVPCRINYTEDLVVDGEIISTYKNFEKFNTEYKNPRNFAAGSIRLLNGEESRERHLEFVAWEVIKGLDYHVTKKNPETEEYTEKHIFITKEKNENLSNKLNDLKKFGFTIVPFIKVKDINNLELVVEELKEKGREFSYPIDGLVFKFDDIQYGLSLGETAHHFKNALAYKFYDDIYETTLNDIEWSVGRTGVLTPIAIFNSVDMDGTEVSRANLHNISIMEEILGEPYKGQKLQVYRANMIIPQVYSAEKKKSIEILNIPDICPLCGSRLEIRNNEGVKTLYCPNENCNGKTLNKLEHFCGKKGLDIKGISEATLNKLMDWNWIKSPIDIFTLSLHRTEWVTKDGFGEKSVDKILNSIQKAKENITLVQFISSLGIPLVGQSVAKLIVKDFPTWTTFRAAVADLYNFAQIPTFGKIKSQSILFFDYTEADKIVNQYLTKLKDTQKIENKINIDNNFIKNKTFCITGKLIYYKNRDELIKTIEAAGGRVSSSVSNKVDYLINNDINSTSSKNKKAKKLNISILSEEDFLTNIQVTKD